MARLVTSGGELQTHPTTTAEASPDGFSAGAALTTTETTVVRSGTASFGCPGTAANTSYRQWDITAPATTVPVYLRAYVRFGVLPNATKKIVALTNGATNLVSVKLTAAGQLQLFNDRTAVQIGSDSTLTLTVDTWYRVDVMLKINTASTAATANDDVELKLAAPGNPEEFETVATATAQAIGNVTPTNVKVGWVDAPGVTSSMFVDDVALNDNTGTKQNAYPGEGRVVAALHAGNFNVANWTTCKGTTTTADFLVALATRPPAAHADATGHATAHQIRNVQTTGDASNNARWWGESYARKGIAGNVLIDGTPGTEREIGLDVPATSEAAVSLARSNHFYFAGTVQYIEVYVKKVGAPTDDLVLEIQTATGLVPTDTVVATMSVPAANIGTTAGWVRFDMGYVPLTVEQGYAVVLRRSGAASSTDYYTWSDDSTATVYVGDKLKMYKRADTLAWVTRAATPSMMRVYGTQGSAVIKVVQAFACLGRGGTVATLQGKIGTTAYPTIADVVVDFGPPSTAAGTFPTGWRWKTTGVVYDPVIRAVDNGVQFRLMKTTADATPALCCFAGTMVEYESLPNPT